MTNLWGGRAGGRGIAGESSGRPRARSRERGAAARAGGVRGRARLVDVVLDEEGLLVRGLGAVDVLARGRLAVGLGAGVELLLGRVDVLRLAAPGLDAGALERARVGEGEARLRLARELVDLVEVDGRVLLGDTAREERDAGHAAGHAALQRADGGGRDGGRVRLVRAVDAGDDHGGLEEGPLEEDAVLLDLLVDGGEDALLRDGRLLDGVAPVEQDLGLDDGDEAGLLADARVPGEVLGRDLDGELRGHVLAGVDLERGAPLGEARAARVVRLAPLEEAVEARAPVLALAAADEGPEAHVDLDAGDDPDALHDVDERRAVRVVLEQGLLVEDRAAHVLGDAGRREEEVPPDLAVLLGVLEADGLEARADRPGRLVAREEALALADHRVRRLLELGRVLAGVRRLHRHGRPRRAGGARRVQRLGAHEGRRRGDREREDERFAHTGCGVYNCC